MTDVDRFTAMVAELTGEPIELPGTKPGRRVLDTLDLQPIFSSCPFTGSAVLAAIDEAVWVSTDVIEAASGQPAKRVATVIRDLQRAGRIHVHHGVITRAVRVRNRSNHTKDTGPRHAAQAPRSPKAARRAPEGASRAPAARTGHRNHTKGQA